MPTLADAVAHQERAWINGMDISPIATRNDIKNRISCELRRPFTSTSQNSLIAAQEASDGLGTGLLASDRVPMLAKSSPRVLKTPPGSPSSPTGRTAHSRSTESPFPPSPRTRSPLHDEEQGIKADGKEQTFDADEGDDLCLLADDIVAMRVKKHTDRMREAYDHQLAKQDGTIRQLQLELEAATAAKDPVNDEIHRLVATQEAVGHRVLKEGLSERDSKIQSLQETIAQLRYELEAKEARISALQATIELHAEQGIRMKVANEDNSRSTVYAAQHTMHVKRHHTSNEAWRRTSLTPGHAPSEPFLTSQWHLLIIDVVIFASMFVSHRKRMMCQLEATPSKGQPTTISRGFVHRKIKIYCSAQLLC